MFYKKLIFIVNIVNLGVLLLFFRMVSVEIFPLSGTVFFSLFAIWMLILVMTPILAIQKKRVVARFGSRAENDIKAHMASIFTMIRLSNPISAQLDVTNEAEMATFVDAFKDIYGKDTLLRAKAFYPELPDQQLDNFLSSVILIDKDVMYDVFFPEKRGGLDHVQAARQLKEQYPYIDKKVLKNLFRWWNSFKSKMKWQRQVDEIDLRR